MNERVPDMDIVRVAKKILYLPEDPPTPNMGSDSPKLVPGVKLELKLKLSLELKRCFDLAAHGALQEKHAPNAQVSDKESSIA